MAGMGGGIRARAEEGKVKTPQSHEQQRLLETPCCSLEDSIHHTVTLYTVHILAGHHSISIGGFVGSRHSIG